MDNLEKETKKYAYDITEQSVDIRHFKVVSNKPLDHETLSQIYMEVDFFPDNTTEDVSEYASRLEGVEVKATTTFQYTYYGDDCQLDISDAYEEEA